MSGGHREPRMTELRSARVKSCLTQPAKKYLPYGGYFFYHRLNKSTIIPENSKGLKSVTTDLKP